MTAGTRPIWQNRFPLKQAGDFLSLAQILVRGDLNSGKPLSLAKRLNCARFYFTADGIRRLHAAPSRSGSLWTQLGLALAIDMAAGGNGEYVYDGQYFPRDGLTHRHLDWRVPTGEVETMFHRGDGGPMLGEPLFLVARYPYWRTRSAQLKNMTIVLVTRNILASLESRFFKFAFSAQYPGVTLDDERSFDWDRHLTGAIDFFNSWGDVLTWHPRIRHFKYEDLKADPVATHKEMLDFWGFDVPEDCVREAFCRASKHEMLKRMRGVDPDNNIRLSVRPADRRGVISPPLKRHIVDRLNRELIFELEYEFDANADYAVAYD